MTPASVVVTTYGRPRSLAACLDGIRAQSRAADEVVVVVHDSDAESGRVVRAFAQDWPALRAAPAERAGLVAALNHGLAEARGEIVAFVDDDAVPTVDWLARLVATFETHPAIAAVGGRDVVTVDGRVHGPAEAGARAGDPGPRVGRIQWFGRQIGNHHLGVGGIQDVDVLKGANMSFRRAAVAGHGFDRRLRGRGVEVHSELSVCLPLRRRGLRLVYDPAIVVRHYPVARPYGDQRDDVRHEAIHDAAHNEALQLLDHFGPARRLVFVAWSTLIGTTEAPGLAILARQLVTRVPHAWARFAAAQAGRLAAWSTRRTTE